MFTNRTVHRVRSLIRIYSGHLWCMLFTFFCFFISFSSRIYGKNRLLNQAVKSNVKRTNKISHPITFSLISFLCLRCCSTNKRKGKIKWFIRKNKNKTFDFDSKMKIKYKMKQIWCYLWHRKIILREIILKEKKRVWSLWGSNSWPPRY